jgi:DNA excision repair protein ERCC-4
LASRQHQNETVGRGSEAAQAVTDVSTVLCNQQRARECSYIYYNRYLAGYDCVTFYSFLQTIMASNTPSDGKLLSNQSPWLLMDAANTIFSVRRVWVTMSPFFQANIFFKFGVKMSKKRFFVEEKDEEYMAVQSARMPGVPKQTKLVLEEQPKWGLLHDILDEIEHDIAVTQDHEG